MTMTQRKITPASLHTRSEQRFGGRIKQVVAAITLCGLSFTASAFEATSDGVYTDRIDWGVVMDMSGPASAAQGLWVNGLKDYMRKVSEAGGIHGRKINVLAEDTRFDASLDRINFEKLTTQTPVLGISGMGNANAQVSLMPAIKRGKVPVVGTYTMTKAGSEPANPMFYGGFCGYKEMAQVGVGFFSEMVKVKAAKVVTVHLDTAGGKEYADYVSGALVANGGSAKSVPIKVTAADATAQVLEIIAQKPDFVAVHGVPNTAILLMRTMQQYGLKIPVFGMTYIGTPLVYTAIGAEAGSNYYFVSCFTPGGADESPGVKEMTASAEKFGHTAMKDDVNYVAGWVVGQVVSESIAKLGPQPTREKLVESMNKGFEVDTKGLSAPIKYTKDDHLGLEVLKPFTYDYTAKKFKAFGNYSDYQKYIK